MNNSERVGVYFIGFIIGMVIVSLLLARRAREAEQGEDPWYQHQAQVEEGGFEPLPQTVESVMLSGDVLRFGFLPNANEPVERVWLLNFRESYPYVRIVENLKTHELSYMAADQIRAELAEEVDVTELKPMLDTLNLRLRMFNRKERVVVLGVVSTQIDAVPETLRAIEPWREYFTTVTPDWIEFKSSSR